MITISVVQGTPQWLAVRAAHFTASEAPAMMGVSKHMSRSALLKQKHTGLTPEVDANKQYLFDRGHAAEAAARPIVEDLIGEELFPCTGSLTVEGLPLLASFDGLSMDESIAWENKLLNESLIAQVKAHDLDAHYYWQLEQQLLVSGAAKVYFTTSDGTAENTHGFWYKSVPERRAQLIAGWKQFAIDLANYEHVEVLPTCVAAPTESLPAVSVRLDGQLVVASNLPEFAVALRSFIEHMPKQPSTDQEFADCEAACKSLKKAEDALESAETHALAQMTDVESLRRSVADLRELARATRLASEKLVKYRKESIRVEIILAATTKLTAHINALNQRLGQCYMPTIAADFAGVIKGKQNLSSLQDAVDTELARAKIEANEVADRIELNLQNGDLAAYRFLFNDIAMLCLKTNEDFGNLAALRVNEHRAKEAARIEAQRVQIAEEERIKAEAAANAIVQAAQAGQARKDQEAIDAVARANAAVIEADIVAERSSVPTLHAQPGDVVITSFQQDNPLVTSVPFGQTCLVGASSFQTINPVRAELNAELDRLSTLELERVLHFVQSRYPQKLAA